LDPIGPRSAFAMKFGKQMTGLVDEEHLNNCIAYDVLKNAINVVIDSAKAAAEAQEAAEASGQPARAPEQRRPPDSRFYELLQHDLAKVNRFAGLQLRTLLDSIREAQRPLQAPAGRGGLSEEVLNKVELQLDSAAERLVAMEDFRRLNFTGFRKIAKKFDKVSRQSGMGKGTLSSWFVPKLLSEYFVSAPLDTHLAAIAWGFASLRQKRGGPVASPQLKPRMEPSSAEASTSIFWLTPSARMRALCLLVKRFELVVPGGSPEMALSGFSCNLSAETSLEYYDELGFPWYTKTLAQAEGEEGPAEGFRCRRSIARGQPALWPDCALLEREGTASALSVHPYTVGGPLRSPDAFPFKWAAMTRTNSPASDEHGVIENLRQGRATHRDPFEEPSASPELRQAAAAALAAVTSPTGDKGGRHAVDVSLLGSEARQQLAGFATEVLAAADAPLQRVATVGSSRLLLRGDTPSTEGVFIALDEDVQFSLGPAGPAATAPMDAIDFPYSLLEVTNGQSEEDGNWMEELQGHAMLRNVVGFSTGAHAIAALHSEAVPELPHWYHHVATVESCSRVEFWGLTKEWREAVIESAPADDAATGQHGLEGILEVPESGAAVSASAQASASGVTKVVVESKGVVQDPPEAAQEEPVLRLQPKNLLASERTALEWMHTVLALAFLGLALWRLSLMDIDEAPVHVALSAAETHKEEHAEKHHHRKHEKHEKHAGKHFLLFGLLNAQSTTTLALGCYSLVLVLVAIVFAWFTVFTHIRRLKNLVTDSHLDHIFNNPLGGTVLALSVATALLVHLVVQATPFFVGDADGGSSDD